MDVRERLVKTQLRTSSRTAKRVPCTDQLPLKFQSTHRNSLERVYSKGITHEPKLLSKIFENGKNPII